MNEVRWLDEREAQAWRGLQFMHLRIDGELARRLAAESSLSYPDYVVLVALTEAPEGRLRLYELGTTLGWEKSRLSHHVTRMTSRGLVAKERCPVDGRGWYVVATDAGRAEIAAAAPGHVAAVRELFVDHLDDDQLDTLAEIAEIVLGALERRDPPD